MTGKAYFISSAVLCGASIAALAVGIAVGVTTALGIEFTLIMLAVCIVLGFIANVLIRKVSGGGRKAVALYVLSFLQYLAPFVVIWLVKQLFLLIKSWSSSTGSSATEKVYTVTENGFERRLEFFGYATDSDGVQFKKYRDDIGNYWRTYDDCNTFVKDLLL